MNKVLIICEGGLVQDVVCSEPTRAVVIDFDDCVDKDDPHYAVLITKDDKSGKEVIDEVWAAEYDTAIDPQLVDDIYEQILSQDEPVGNLNDKETE